MAVAVGAAAVGTAAVETAAVGAAAVGTVEAAAAHLPRSAPTLEQLFLQMQRTGSVAGSLGSSSSSSSCGGSGSGSGIISAPQQLRLVASAWRDCGQGDVEAGMMRALVPLVGGGGWVDGWAGGVVVGGQVYILVGILKCMILLPFCDSTRVCMHTHTYTQKHTCAYIHAHTRVDYRLNIHTKQCPPAHPSAHTLTRTGIYRHTRTHRHI